MRIESTENTKGEKVARIRGKVFAGRSTIRTYAKVYGDTLVRVWDAVEEHWTTCHSLSESEQKRIREAVL